MSFKVEPILIWLFIGIFLSVGIMIYEEHYIKDVQTFTVITNLVSGFSGAFFARMNPQGDKKEKDSV